MPVDLNIIGKENLPNLYISSIEIHEGSNTSMLSRNSKETINLNLVFSIFNTLTISGDPYFYKSNFIDTIRLFISTDPITTEELRKNSVLLNKHIKRNHASRNDNQYIEVTLNEADYGKYLKLDELKKINKTIKIQKVSIKDHLTVFACLHRETQNTEEYGPTIAEVIIDDSQIPLNTTLFLQRGTTNIWPGPIHLDEDRGFMNDSFHISQRNQSFLNTLRIYNLKTKDYRFKFVNNQQQNSSMIMDKNIFSPLESSIDEKGNYNVLFSINTKELLKKHSKQAQILQDIYPEMIDKFEDIQIKRLEIYSGGKLVIRTNSIGDKLAPTSNNVAKIQNIKLSDKRYIYSANCHIKNIALQKKHLSLKVSINNPIKVYLEELRKRLVQKSSKYLNSFVSHLLKRNLYNRDTLVYNRSLIYDIYDKRLNPRPWVACVKTLIEGIRVIYNQTGVSSNELIRNLTAMVCPKTCTIESIQYVIKFSNSIISKLTTMYDLTENQLYNNLSSNVGSSNVQDINAIKHYKNIEEKFNNKSKTYIQNQNPTGFINTYKVDDFIQLLDYEKFRFSSENYLATNNNTTFTEHATFSPTIISKGEERFNLNLLKEINEDNLSKFADSLQLSDDNINDLFGKNIRATKIAETYDFESDLLGDGTNVFDEPELEIPSPNVANRLLSRSMARIIRNLSVPSANSITMNKTESEYSTIPVQHIFLLNEDVVQREMGSIESLFNQKQYTKDVMFFNLQRIKYYELDDSNGIGNTNYSDLTINVLANLTTPIVCKMFEYYDPDFNSSTNQFKNYKAVNRIFIIYPNNYNINSSNLIQTNPLTVEGFSAFMDLYASQDFCEYEFSKNMYFIENTHRRESVNNSLTKKEIQIRESVYNRNRRRIERNLPKDPKEVEESTRRGNLEVMLKETKPTEGIEENQQFIERIRPQTENITEAATYSTEIGNSPVSPVTTSTQTLNQTQIATVQNNQQTSRSRTSNQRQTSSRNTRRGY